MTISEHEVAADSERPKAWEILTGCLIAPIGIPLLFILALLSIPVTAIFGWRQTCRERLLFDQLSQHGRGIRWLEVVTHLEAGHGTLLIEQHIPKGPWRHWWTPDDVIAMAPTELPELTFELKPEPGPAMDAFGRQVIETYFDERFGKALLAIDFPVNERIPFAERYPDAGIVTVLFEMNDLKVIATGDYETAHQRDRDKDKEEA